MATYTVQELHGKVFEGAYRTYGVFRDFFGEENVDLQDVTPLDTFEANCNELDTSALTDEGLLAQLRKLYGDARPCIYVHWDKVTVTNENDKSTEIRDLYAQVPITPEGTMPYESKGFKLNRSTYSQAEWAGNYMHSHCYGIPKDNVTKFVSPCLGTGPIRGTILELKRSGDEAEWMLFCQELDMYVTVESLAGKPYFYLEELGNPHTGPASGWMHNGYRAVYSHEDRSNPRTGSLSTACGDTFYGDFVEYYLRNGHLKFNYANNSFSVGMDYFTFMMDISNCFVRFFNERCHNEGAYNQLVTNQVLLHVTIEGNRFYRDGSDYISPAALQGKRVLTFKGKDILLHITGERKDRQCSVLLAHYLAMHILANILKVINYRYKNEYDEQRKSGGATESLAAPEENVRYL